MKTILAGDIGGTKTKLALYSPSAEGFSLILENIYCSQDFQNFNDILRDFLTLVGNHPIVAFGLSVAGPVIRGECHTTNLPWRIKEADIRSEFNIDKIALLNDIRATGYGLLNASSSQLVQINPGATLTEGNRAIVSIGTGLGEGYLFWDGHCHHPMGSEGGHSDFAPLTNEDLGLWKFLNEKYPEHISYERIISGPGISLIYEYLCGANDTPSQAPNENPSAWISDHALRQSDQLCIDTMNIFMRYLAAETANLALKVFANGGIYITGGIAPKIETLFHQPNFIENFLAKGRFKSALSMMPIWINKSEETPLLGALACANKLFP